MGDSRPRAAMTAETMASSEPQKVTCTVIQAPCSSRGRRSVMNVYRSMHGNAPRTGVRGVARSLLAAEFGGGLVGDVGLVETEGFDRGQVLFATDPLLQFGIHRIAQVLVFGAEGQGAVA